MASEADLDAEIKALSIWSEHAELYEELVKLGCANSLVSLLSHENTDIAIDAIQIISELTDEDVEAEEEQWDVLVNALVDCPSDADHPNADQEPKLQADILNLLVQNFSRLDEDIESDRSGVYHSLGKRQGFISDGRSLTNARCAREFGFQIRCFRENRNRDSCPTMADQAYATARVFSQPK